MFIAGLFIVVKTWKRPVSIEKWMDKGVLYVCVVYVVYVCVYVYTHTHSGVLVVKREWNNAICSYMGRPRDYHTKWSQR